VSRSICTASTTALQNVASASALPDAGMGIETVDDASLNCMFSSDSSDVFRRACDEERVHEVDADIAGKLRQCDVCQRIYISHSFLVKHKRAHSLQGMKIKDGLHHRHTQDFTMEGENYEIQWWGPVG